jgi:FMN phosphatase YigB (HAD superfamily)
MKRRMLVCDLDNTLYDWVGYFVAAFYAMVDEVVRITNCDRDRLLDDFRDIHIRHHDSEHPFAVLETRIIQEYYSGLSRKEMAEQLDSAFHIFNVYRKEHLKVYPGVHETLESLSKSGVVLVAHTESKLYAVVDCLNRLGLTKYFRRIYCIERSNSKHPNLEIGEKWLENFPLEQVVELSHHQRKPNPEVLLEICGDEGISPAETAYVGDSLTRDVSMAKESGVFAFWAKSGVIHDENKYDKLVRISHWTAEDVARERALKKKVEGIQPDHVLENNFSDLLCVLSPSLFPTAANR